MKKLNHRHQPREYLIRNFILNRDVYVFMLPAIIYLFIFNYLPMYGVLMAFKDFRPRLGIWGSPWVGLKHFHFFFSLQKFPEILLNTLVLSVYQLAAGFPLPIILALSLNSCRFTKLKKVVQTVTYAPHFISTVVIVGMLNLFFSPSLGPMVNILRIMGWSGDILKTLMNPDSFPHLYVWSGIWQNIGWNSIIYLSALSGVDPALHESARVDGANKLQRIIFIDFPSILPTIVILLILDCGKIMNVGFEKVFLMQNPLNISASEIISTYVYKTGLREGQFSLATAIGLFNSVINFVLLVSVNKIAKRWSEYSLW
ncbi:ABC transporter permease subunit [Treponema sp. OttesenSCG-928-L16]|nr:ABC transporter permease subunit [Treponema sp. OttesenSCG-928-L16]